MGGMTLKIFLKFKWILDQTYLEIFLSILDIFKRKNNFWPKCLFLVKGVGGWVLKVWEIPSFFNPFLSNRLFNCLYQFIMDITWILTLKLVPTSLNVKQPHNELSILECPKNLNIWLVLSQLINNLVFCVPNHH